MVFEGPDLRCDLRHPLDRQCPLRVNLGHPLCKFAMSAYERDADQRGQKLSKRPARCPSKI